ncbi:elongin-C isoform X1 [Canis lupus dingo]|uniref:elongin-C isoform X1 n=1 Tax=Canis lupus dingo TaxID=286419 RepID=UPI0020C2A90E|nr:elongin-C isoform X1 [Canis lupus dingo]XP_048959634.1 elongin-C isoform X1 [Canis lupus dingo]XP_048959635.1 elongin-C isoform X1 [Canis lupus dingo]XP_048959636.1 elongin-C isoform X1 [Canis lupus dingo]XP_048959637.1 elongin-C isoform X1 [Canis lupus dingo]
MDGEEKTYGGCEGPDAMYVKLISSDGHEFIVKREHALTSGTIKAMLSGPGFIYVFMSGRDTGREKQAPCRKPGAGLNPGAPGSQPEPKVSLLRTKLMKSILERSLHMCYQKYACILPTRFATLTAPQRFLNSQLHLKLHWNC